MIFWASFISNDRELSFLTMTVMTWGNLSYNGLRHIGLISFKWGALFGTLSVNSKQRTSLEGFSFVYSILLLSQGCCKVNQYNLQDTLLQLNSNSTLYWVVDDTMYLQIHLHTCYYHISLVNMLYILSAGSVSPIYQFLRWQPMIDVIFPTFLLFLYKLCVKIRFVWWEFFEFFYSSEINPLISRKILDNLPLSYIQLVSNLLFVQFDPLKKKTKKKWLTLKKLDLR